MSDFYSQHFNPQILIDICRNKELRLAVAESCTGGLISKILTDVPGSSSVLECGLVSYSNDSKTRLLHVSPDLLRLYGAVSESVAKTMARNVRRLNHVDFGISTTGIAGPDGGTEDKPVGLVYMAIASSSAIWCWKRRFKGDRSTVRNEAAHFVLSKLSIIVENYTVTQL